MSDEEKGKWTWESLKKIWDSLPEHYPSKLDTYKEYFFSLPPGTSFIKYKYLGWNSKILLTQKASQKLYWSTPLDLNIWDTSAFTDEFYPDLFNLPPVPTQDPALIESTIKQEWNL